MKKIYTKIEIDKIFGPLQQKHEVEGPLNKLLQEANCGVVLGGLAKMKMNENGKRELKGCVLDVILTSPDEGMRIIKSFLKDHNLAEITRVIMDED